MYFVTERVSQCDRAGHTEAYSTVPRGGSMRNSRGHDSCLAAAGLGVLRRNRSSQRGSLAFSAVVLLYVTAACAKSSSDISGDGADGSAGTGAANQGGGAGESVGDAAGGAAGSGGGLNIGGSLAADGAGANGSELIYAHTDTELYQLDPTSPGLSLMLVGAFDCIGASGQDVSMTDLAVDKNEGLWGISAKAVHPLSVAGGMVHCGPPVQLNNPKGVSFYGLTFAPAGVLDSAKEALVAGNTAGELWAVDDQGNLSEHGTFGLVPPNDGNGHDYANAGQPWELSGDIVFVANSGSPVGFATVRDCSNPPYTSNCSSVNTLIEIDVPKLATATTESITKAVRGQIVKRAGCQDATTGDYGNMYGIAAWNDKVYGFSRSGDLVEIATQDGSACLVQPYPSAKFAGAGVTTLAPVITPQPK